jgi:hypothetical protein
LLVFLSRIFQSFSNTLSLSFILFSSVSVNRLYFTFITNMSEDEQIIWGSYFVNSREEVWDADGKFYGHMEVGADGGFTLKKLIPEFSEPGATAKSPETKKWQPSRESQVNLGGNSCADEKEKDYEDFQRMQKVCSTDVYEMDADRYERRQERFATWQKAQDRRVLRTISEFCGE